MFEALSAAAFSIPIEQLALYLIGIATSVLVLIYIGTIYLSKKGKGKRGIQSIPTGLIVKPDQEEYQKQILETLEKQGLGAQLDYVTKMIKLKVPRLNMSLLQTDPKEIVETFFCGDLDATKRLLLDNSEGEKQAFYFWNVADIAWVQLDFRTALYYLEQARKLDPEDEAIDENYHETITLWESRDKSIIPDYAPAETE
ncbi:MAG: hypothetical protein QNL04_06670 [SAR324 cluster bacterium]|nr:hypothetical protein [SAR324 cluster bacterium]